MGNQNPENENVNTDADNASENVNNESVNNDAAQQTETDWKEQARKWEARAKENFSFKADAEKYREYVESQKTEYEKLQEAEAKTRLELEELRTDSIKKDIALEKSVPQNLLKYLTGTTREELETQADELLSVIAESAKPNSKPNPEQGKPIGNTEADSLTSWVQDNILGK